MPRIAQHDVGEVNSRIGRIDFASKALLDQVRNVSAMVNVRVGEDHRVNLTRIKRKMEIRIVGFLTFTLEATTFQEQFLSTMFNEHHRAGDRSGCA